jgi:hypothetical protein
MIGPIRIFCFSGTGNTGLVARELEVALVQSGCSVVAERIEDYTRPGKIPEIAMGETLGIGFAVHALNAPRIVFEFIDRLPYYRGGNGRAFI